MSSFQSLPQGLLFSEQQKQKDMSSPCEDKMNLTDLILECDIIPILVEKELTIECCIRGYHVYQDQAKIGNTLKVSRETRVAALVEDQTCFGC